jgi:RHS repeat-associated protein
VLHWETDPPPGVTNDQYRYSLVDHLNSCTLELTDDARVISQETYYPFGATAWSAGPNDTDGDYKTVRYSGKERDATGLYYYGFRYYIPWLQRWLSPDPAGVVDGLNLFRMVRNNPVLLTDDKGLVSNKKKAQSSSRLPQTSLPERSVGRNAANTSVETKVSGRPTPVTPTRLDSPFAPMGISAKIAGNTIAQDQRLVAEVAKVSISQPETKGSRQNVKAGNEKAVGTGENSTPDALENKPNWLDVLNSGQYNDKPVYIHYTSSQGAEAISREKSISDKARGEKRAGSKGGVYVNPPGQQFDSENVENLLFLGNERYRGSGDYMVIFSSDQVPEDLGAVTQGSPFVELKMHKEIKLSSSSLLYLGKNIFPDYFG